MSGLSLIFTLPHSLGFTCYSEENLEPTRVGQILVSLEVFIRQELWGTFFPRVEDRVEGPRSPTDSGLLSLETHV